MRKLFILSILISLINLSYAQTAPFTKKDWKKFNTSFTENLNAAQQFYNGNIDYENKNQFNFMPTSKVVLHNTSSNSIDDMGYISYNSYDFTTKEEALAFYNALKQNLELPKNYSITEEGQCEIAFLLRTRLINYS